MNLNKILSGMNKSVLIRMPSNYPNIEGGDVDILTEDIKYLEKYLKKNLSKNYILKKRLGQRGNIHFDIYKDDKIFIIKFDVSDSVNKLYPEYNIPADYTKKVILNANKNVFGINVPKIDDELSLRWLEYDKYKKERPDKIKHLHYIEKNKNVKFEKFKKIIF